MDYPLAEQQMSQVQQQAQVTMEKLQSLAEKLRTRAPDETTGREWAMDLREIAMTMQQQSQTTMMLFQQMGQYIHTLENELHSHPAPTVQPRGWGGGGGFLSSLTSGLGMGAGFAVAEDAVNDIFNAF
ncbi:MAG: hypothetical protein WCC36_00745 [Gammaproteobacteria bacterium]